MPVLYISSSLIFIGEDINEAICSGFFWVKFIILSKLSSVKEDVFSCSLFIVFLNSANLSFIFFPSFKAASLVPTPKSPKAFNWGITNLVVSNMSLAVSNLLSNPLAVFSIIIVVWL